MSIKPLLLRADAGENIGNGHVMRCLALAEAWQKRGGETFLISCNLSPSLRDTVAEAGVKKIFEPKDADDQAAVVETAVCTGARWVAMDGYHFKKETVDALAKMPQFSMLLIDDSKSIPGTDAQAVLNPNLHAAKLRAQEREILALCGPRFALIRNHARWSGDRPVSVKARNLLITFGGSDPDNHTEKALRAIAALPDSADMKIRIILGNSNPHGERISTALRSLNLDAEVHLNVPRMGEYFGWADMAVMSASTTFLEASSSALPCILVQTADNQAPVLEAAKSLGVAITLSATNPWEGKNFQHQFATLWHSSQQRQHLSQKARSFIDGKGADRVAAALCAFHFTLRDANTGNCREVWRWANDAESRSMSFHGDPIPYEKHQAWFSARLESSECLMLVVETEDAVPFGICRFDRKPDSPPVISINFAPEYRSLGVGTRVLRAATLHASTRWSGTPIRAFIKKENTRSARTFERAGYVAVASPAESLCMDWSAS